MPMRVVLDEPDLTVAWLAPATLIMYWPTAAGRDPRQSPLDQRFRQPLTKNTNVAAAVVRPSPNGSAGRPFPESIRTPTSAVAM
jgi:hypothetical protein